MTENVPQQVAFAYQAQTPDGQTVSGSIDARDVEHAQQMLATLRLRVLQIEPAQRPPRPKALRGDDFLAFNQQLTHLTAAGLPVEHGLRLIAQDMRSGRLQETVRQLAAEMERGTSVEQAFEKHREQFPPLYGRLVAAGIAAHNLPGMLLSLGRHVEMVNRLRATLWRAAAYPIMVMTGLAVVMAFIALIVVPQFRQIFQSFGMQLPFLTRMLISLPEIAWPVLIALAVVIVLIPVTWLILKQTGGDRAVMDQVVLRVPLIGPIVRRNLIARWCDAVRLGVQAGLDLPRALELAGDAVDSPALRRDGHELIGALQSGQPLDRLVGSTRMLPATVPAALALGGERHDLPSTLGTLSEMYQQQAETRLVMVPGLLAPVLVILMACVIGVVILAMFLPFLTLVQNLTGH
jgi:type IV pilus assembly protein PilC